MNNSLEKSHLITLSNKNILDISEVKKIIKFNKEEFVIDTSLGNIVVTGQNLEMTKFDTIMGNIQINGTVNMIKYSDSIKQENILQKLFK